MRVFLATMALCVAGMAHAQTATVSTGWGVLTFSLTDLNENDSIAPLLTATQSCSEPTTSTRFCTLHPSEPTHQPTQFSFGTSIAYAGGEGGPNQVTSSAGYADQTRFLLSANTKVTITGTIFTYASGFQTIAQPDGYTNYAFSQGNAAASVVDANNVALQSIDVVSPYPTGPRIERTFEFSVQSGAQDRSFGLDLYAGHYTSAGRYVTPVPEPDTLALVVGGLAVLVLQRRRVRT